MCAIMTAVLLPAWLQNVNNLYSKIVPGFSNLSYRKRLHALNLPSLLYHRRRMDMIMV